MNLNKCTFAGNLTKDPELRYTTSGKPVTSFCVACNRHWTSKDGEKKKECYFADATAWGKDAETIAQYFQKGDAIYIEGRMKRDTWEDGDGKKRSRDGVVVERWQFVSGKRQGAQGDARQSAQTAPSVPAADDIPF